MARRKARSKAAKAAAREARIGSEDLILAALFRTARKARNRSRYTRKAKHRLRED